MPKCAAWGVDWRGFLLLGRVGTQFTRRGGPLVLRARWMGGETAPPSPGGRADREGSRGSVTSLFSETGETVQEKPHRAALWPQGGWAKPAASAGRPSVPGLFRTFPSQPREICDLSTELNLNFLTQGDGFEPPWWAFPRTTGPDERERDRRTDRQLSADWPRSVGQSADVTAPPLTGSLLCCLSGD